VFSKIGKSLLTEVLLLNSYKGWVMDATAKEAANSISHTPKFRYLPGSRRDFLSLDVMFNSLGRTYSDSLIMGYETYLRALAHGKVVESTCNLYYTHQNYAIDPNVLNSFARILVMNSAEKIRMSLSGVLDEKILVVYGAIDKELFSPVSGRGGTTRNSIKNNYVLIASDCKPRKNPKKILQLIRVMPNIDFVIHGKGWGVEFAQEISSLSNLTYLPFNFKNQPELIKSASAFLSLSFLEGGPYPLLDALASGTPAVVTPTGFARDFVNDTNGFVVEEDATLDYISEMILRAIDLKSSVFEKDLTGKNLSWEDLAMGLYARA
jgi:glycosyltransferase involved in cell wall biosynthesis